MVVTGGIIVVTKCVTTSQVLLIRDVANLNKGRRNNGIWDRYGIDIDIWKTSC